MTIMFSIFNNNKSTGKLNGEEKPVTRAKQNFQKVLASNDIKKNEQYGVRWNTYANRMRDTIDTFTTSIEVLHYAQSKIGFEHRNNTAHEGKFTALYENQLYAEFPQFRSEIDQFSDVDDSLPNTTYIHKDRPISNILFYLTRVVLSCLTHITDVDIILEIGGGYGAPARLWMKNPIRRPKAYIIVDLPESLFFSDVFLSSQFSSEDVLYIYTDDPIDSKLLSKYKFILCPVQYINSLQNLPVDLVINTGSMQEMSEGWINFYMAWLDKQRCTYFYSLNYFAQPISYLAESINLWSPRLSPKWKSKFMRWNPAFIRMQTDRNYLEMIAKKETHQSRCDKNSEIQSVINYYSERFLTGEAFAEIMDVIRCTQDDELMYKILLRCYDELEFWPKELMWIAKWLANNKTDIYISNKESIDNIYSKLQDSRNSGIEGIHH